MAYCVPFIASECISQFHEFFFKWVVSSPSRRNHPTQLSTHLNPFCCRFLPFVALRTLLTGKTTVWEVVLSGFLSSEKSSTPRTEVQSEYHHFARMWKCENLHRLKSEKKGTQSEYSLFFRCFIISLP